MVSPLAKRVLRHLPAALGVVLLFGAVFVVQREFRHLNVRDVGHALAAIPRRALWEAAVLSVLSYGLLTFYDKLATIYAGHHVSFARTAFASFCAYALAHNLGFSAVSGAAVRYRLYAHWGLSPVQIGKVVAFSSLTFGLGGMTLGGLILFTEPSAVPLLGETLPRWLLYAAGLAMWAVVGTYVVLASLFPVIHVRGRLVELPGWRMALAQVGLATADVSLTASIFYVLLPHAHGLSWARFLAVYLGSYAAGLASNVPGGLGVFDTAMLLGLESTHLSKPVILGAIAVFRLFYYVVPLFAAGALFAGNEVLVSRRQLSGPLAPGQPRWSEPDFAAAASTGGVAICGAMLLSIGVLDTHPDYSWIDPGFSSFAASAGQYVPSLLGTALMVLAVGLSQRVTLAWGATIAGLLAGAAITALQGEPVFVPAILVIAALSIAPFRDAYYRHARLLSHPMRPGTVVPGTGAAVQRGLAGQFRAARARARSIELVGGGAVGRRPGARAAGGAACRAAGPGGAVGRDPAWPCAVPGVECGRSPALRGARRAAAGRGGWAGDGRGGACRHSVSPLARRAARPGGPGRCRKRPCQRRVAPA